MEYSLLSQFRKIFRAGFVRRVLYVLLPLVIAESLPLWVDSAHSWYVILYHAIWIWFVLAVVMSVNGILRSLSTLWLAKSTKRDRPMKGFIQVLQMVVTFVGGIVIVSILIGKSPLTLITGLGAFAAVLMLVFRDSILGFVSGVLLTENDMIRLGDWIEIPTNHVNGIVQDISLTIVKVRNWDNTIVTVPPYTLISGSFINWRGMQHSGGRRIMREITLMVDYIKPCTPAFLEKMKEFDEELGAFIASHEERNRDKKGLVDDSLNTNLGLLRAYLNIYLRKHPAVNTELLLMVRILPCTENGVPLQVYCFCRNKNWIEYESVQAGIMEHFLSVLSAFELHAYQNTSARDNIINGLLEGGYRVGDIHDLPWGIIKEKKEVS